jgi:hypothetical protein
MTKTIWFNGYKFTKDDKSGYYLSATQLKDGKQVRLHRYVWEHFNGEIPQGYHVHHKDGDKSNNDISNLEALSHQEHLNIHHELWRNDEGVMNKKKANLDKIRPLTVEWHRSKEGRKWHSEHAKKVFGNREKEKFFCKHCGDSFETLKVKENKFCSNKCKSAWRRESGVDDEKRNCEYCQKEFVVNKYSKKRFCGMVCSNKAIPRLPQLKNKGG